MVAVIQENLQDLRNSWFWFVLLGAVPMNRPFPDGSHAAAEAVWPAGEFFWSQEIGLFSIVRMSSLRVIELAQNSNPLLSLHMSYT